MKATLSLILIAVSILSYSQSSLIKNKLAIVYDINYNPKNYIDENDGIREIGIKETLKRTNFEHSLTLNYKLINKLSVSLIGGIHSNEIINKSNYSYTIYPGSTVPKINSYSFGGGINLFFKKGLAPSDSHIGIYIKKHNYKIKEENVIDAIYGDYYHEDRTTIYNLQATGDATLNMTLLGFKYVYTRMITKTLPIYYNIGIHYTFPIIKKNTYADIEYDEASYNSFYLDHIIDQQFALDYYRELHRFRINLGVGYIF